jgi:hypothetical protein
MSDLLDTRDKLSEAQSLVELLFMAAGDLEPEWGMPLRIGAMKAGDMLSDITADLDRFIKGGEAA